MPWHRIPDQGTLQRPRRSGLIYSTSCASFILAQPTHGTGLQLAAELWIESFTAKPELMCPEEFCTGSLLPGGLTPLFVGTPWSHRLEARGFGITSTLVLL